MTQCARWALTCVGCMAYRMCLVDSTLFRIVISIDVLLAYMHIVGFKMCSPWAHVNRIFTQHTNERENTMGDCAVWRSVSDTWLFTQVECQVKPWAVSI